MFQSQIPEQIRQLSAYFDLSVLHLLFPSQKKLVPKTGNFLFLNRLSKKKALLGFPLFHMNEHFDCLYCRGYYAAKAGLSLKSQAKIIIDLRGLISEELKFQGGLFGRMKSLFYLRLESQFVKKADLLVVVSENFKKHVQNRCGRKDALPIRPFVNVERFAYDPAARESIRRKLGFSEQDTVLVYCGDTCAWQKCPETIRLFKELNQKDPRIKMLFITQDRLTGFPANGFTTLRLENEEVPKYLNASDFGVLLRDDLLLNRLAYPTKFSEYLLCGLPVIMTRNIGCAQDADPSNSLFIELKELDGDLLLAEMRQRQFDRRKISEEYRNKILNKELFDTLLSGRFLFHEGRKTGSF